MQLRSAKNLVGAIAVAAALTSAVAVSQESHPAGSRSDRASFDRLQARALRRQAAPDYRTPKLLGVYHPDGKFRTPSRFAHLVEYNVRLRDVRRSEVPSFIDLKPVGRVVEDFEPPAHAQKAVQKHSLFADVRDRIVTLAYGRQSVLQSPTHVTTDSKQRLIISDPGEPAIHVLDPRGKHTFRITGGHQHRMQSPNGVAVDADDNIYVADGTRGMVLVYDAHGQFRRYIGEVGGESMLQNPTGIAIDRRAGRLYVLDSPAAELIVFDLEGRVVSRIGDRRLSRTGVKFDNPTEIALGRDGVIVLDAHASRIQVLDRECRFVRSFNLRNVLVPPDKIAEAGLALDSTGNIYVSNAGSSAVKIYSQAGQLLASMGRAGSRPQEFDLPSGVWIDASDRIYVADTRNSRVQVFQFSGNSDEPVAGHRHGRD